MAIMKPSSYVGGNACRLSVGNHLLYLHMSSHYRRICNAKCTVDTSPPCVYKLNRSATRRWRHHISSHQSDISSCSPTDCELGLADIIANDTQQSPHTYLGHTWTEQEMLSQTRGLSSHKQQHQYVEGTPGHHRGRDTCRTLCRPPASKVSSSYCKRAAGVQVPLPDIMDQHVRSFTSPDQAFKPRILKTETQSRLRDSRVYHPPSRRSRLSDHGKLQQQHQQSEEEVMSGRTSARCSDLCDAQKHVSSKESSRDSAYNGGTSSSAESRGPTPVVMCPTGKGATLNRAQLQSSSIRKEDAAYIKFVHDITEDVLARGIYSDRGLQQLFQRHVADNEGQLSLDRMKEEVARLCEQLGILQTDCGGELFQLAQRSEFLSQASGCMQEVRCVEAEPLQPSTVLEPP